MRRFLVWWMYAMVLGHLLVGLALPWVVDAPLLEGYHRGIEAAFWGQAAPAPARAQQMWWIALFGPTVQCMTLYMGALVRVGDTSRSSFAWAALIAGLVLWAPQDMAISLRAACWPHVWVDSVALLLMLPPLAWLWQHDRKRGAP